MKNGLCFLLLLVSFGLFAQTDSFRISGTIKGPAPAGGYLYLAFPRDGNYVIDSSATHSGAYLFKGVVSGVVPATLFDVSPRSAEVNEPGHVLPIVLTGGAFAIQHVDSFRNVTFTGSSANADYSRLKTLAAPIAAQQRALSEQYEQAMATNDTAAVLAAVLRPPGFSRGNGLSQADRDGTCNQCGSDGTEFFPARHGG